MESIAIVVSTSQYRQLVQPQPSSRLEYTSYNAEILVLTTQPLCEVSLVRTSRGVHGDCRLNITIQATSPATTQFTAGVY
jgi:hypothetical protein